MARLDGLKANDVRWRDGHAFTLAYSAGEDVIAVAEVAYAKFSRENALNTDAFPSLHRIQNDVVGMVGDWLQAGPEGAGFMTTGGTESLLMAVKAARERGRKERSITTPTWCCPPAPMRRSRRAATTSGWRAVAYRCAPTGGPTYLARLGHDIAPWNFSVPGVTSISVDLHKFGYTAKGASVIAYRTKLLRSYQTYVTDNWLGGVYGSSGILGTKSGGSMAAAWAVIDFLGDEGYVRLTAAARRATETLVAGVRQRPHLALRAEPDTMLVTFGATDPASLDIYSVADALWRRGWYVDKQGPPASLHLTVNAIHDGKIDAFLADLDGAVAEVQASSMTGSVGTYGTVE